MSRFTERLFQVTLVAVLTYIVYQFAVQTVVTIVRQGNVIAQQQQELQQLRPHGQAPQAQSSR